MTANLSLTRGQRVTLELGGSETLGFEDVVVESIEAGPSEAYPAGSGVSVTLIVEGGRSPERRQVSLLSSGYRSHPVAWFGPYRVTLVDVKDPHRAAQVDLVVERVSERSLPGEPVVVRVEAGQSITLGDAARVEFLGHSTKHIDAGERPPLMVALKYHIPGEAPLSTEFNVGTDDRPQTWTWRDYRLTIVEYVYNAWMRVSVERLALDRVPAR